MLQENDEKTGDKHALNVELLRMPHRHLLLMLLFTTLLDSSSIISPVLTVIYMDGKYSNEPKSGLT